MIPKKIYLFSKVVAVVIAFVAVVIVFYLTHGWRWFLVAPISGLAGGLLGRWFGAGEVTKEEVLRVLQESPHELDARQVTAHVSLSRGILLRKGWKDWLRPRFGRPRLASVKLNLRMLVETKEISARRADSVAPGQAPRVITLYSATNPPRCLHA